MRSLLAVLVIAAGQIPIPTPGRLADTGTPGLPTGIIDWSKSGSRSWYGAPTPTVECRAASGGGDVICSGATPTKAGTPTTVGTPYHPDGFVGATELDVPAVRLNTGTDSFSLGDVVDAPNGFTGAVQFSLGTVAGVKYIFTKDDGSAHRQWNLLASANTVTFYAFKVLGTYSSVVCGTAVAGAWNTIAFSYSPGTGDGTGVLRCNMNGVAATPTTGAVAPIPSDAQPTRIGGTLTDGTLAVASANAWDGWVASDAELALMVADQQGRRMARPATSLVTWTRNDTRICCPLSATACYRIPPNTPCVRSTGADIWGAANNSNQLSNSNAASALATYVSAGGSLTVTDGATTDPVGYPAFRIQASAPAANDYAIKYGYNLPAGTHTLSMICRGVSGPGTVYLNYYPAGGAITQAVACNYVADSWTRASATITSAGVINWIAVGRDCRANPTGSTDAYVAWMKAEASSVLGPPVYATGVPYVGSGEAVSITSTLTSPSAFCLGAQATPADWSTGANGYLLGWGAAGAANTARVLSFATGGIYFGAFDATPAERYVLPAEPTAGKHEVVGCDLGGMLTVDLDNIRVSGAQQGAGTGVLTAVPTTLYIGGSNSGTLQINGGISGVCEGRTAASVRRCLGRIP